MQLCGRGERGAVERNLRERKGERDMEKTSAIMWEG